jgi:hypothetical protein
LIFTYSYIPYSHIHTFLIPLTPSVGKGLNGFLKIFKF